jgi:hypothetical protein
MKTTALILSLAVLATPAGLSAQSNKISSHADETVAASGITRADAARQAPPPLHIGLFTRMALGIGVSPLGPSVQLTTSLAPHLNLRATGSGIKYNTTFNTNGFDAKAKLNLASAGIAADIYPFHTGFRLSPGLLVFNNNRIGATALAAGGTEITLNDQSFYSATANTTTGATPLNVDATLGLRTNRPAFTMTAGWGNTIPRNGHWSFPFEAGVAFIGQPSVKVNLTGWACSDQTQTDCSDVTGTSTMATEVQSDLAAQITRWQNDLDPLKTYPIVSFGIVYSFNLRSNQAAR